MKHFHFIDDEKRLHQALARGEVVTTGGFWLASSFKREAASGSATNSSI